MHVLLKENTWLVLPRTFCFCIYINDLPKDISSQCKPILFVNDSSICISHTEIDYFQNCMNNVFNSLSKWLKTDKLTLNFEKKTNLIKLSTKSKTCINVNVWHDDKTTEEVETTKFLDLQIDNNLNWKIYIEYIIPKLDSVVGIATGYGLDDQGVRVRVPVGSRIFSSPSHPDRLWGPPNLLSNGYWGLFPRG
jgi:hypothetical protein